MSDTVSERYLSRFWMLNGLEADIIDEDMGKVIPRGRKCKVDLPGQVGQLVVALAIVGDHVVDFCNSTVCQTVGSSRMLYSRGASA